MNSGRNDLADQVELNKYVKLVREIARQIQVVRNREEELSLLTAKLVIVADVLNDKVNEYVASRLRSYSEELNACREKVLKLGSDMDNELSLFKMALCNHLRLNENSIGTLFIKVAVSVENFKAMCGVYKSYEEQKNELKSKIISCTKMLKTFHDLHEKAKIFLMEVNKKLTPLHLEKVNKSLLERQERLDREGDEETRHYIEGGSMGYFKQRRSNAVASFEEAKIDENTKAMCIKPNIC